MKIFAYLKSQNKIVKFAMQSLPADDFWNHVFEKYYGKSWQRDDSFHSIRTSIYSKSKLHVSRHCIATIICLPIIGAFIFGLIPIASDIWYAIYVFTYKCISCAIGILSVEACLPMVIETNRIKYGLIPFLVLSTTIILTSIALSLNAPKDEITFAAINYVGTWIIYLSYLVAIIIKQNKSQINNKQNINNLNRIHSVSIDYDDDGKINNCNENCNNMEQLDGIWSLVIYTLITHSLSVTAYLFCQYTTSLWTDNNGYDILIYIQFEIVINVLKVVTKFFARWIDSHELKLAFDSTNIDSSDDDNVNDTYDNNNNNNNNYDDISRDGAIYVLMSGDLAKDAVISRIYNATWITPISVEILVELEFVAFYFLFYRNLFFRLTTYITFILMQLLHILIDAIYYPFRMTHFYYQISCECQTIYINFLKSFNCYACNKLVEMIEDNSSYQQLCARVSLDYTIRYIGSIESAISFTIISLWLRYGYVNKYYHSVDQINGKFFESVTFTLIAGFVEFCIFNAFNVILIQWTRISINFQLSFKHLINNNNKYWIIFVCGLTHITTDIMFFLAVLEAA